MTQETLSNSQVLPSNGTLNDASKPDYSNYLSSVTRLGRQDYHRIGINGNMAPLPWRSVELVRALEFYDGVIPESLALNILNTDDADERKLEQRLSRTINDVNLRLLERDVDVRIDLTLHEFDEEPTHAVKLWRLTNGEETSSNGNTTHNSELKNASEEPGRANNKHAEVKPVDSQPHGDYRIGAGAEEKTDGLMGRLTFDEIGSSENELPLSTHQESFVQDDMVAFLDYLLSEGITKTDSLVLLLDSFASSDAPIEMKRIIETYRHQFPHSSATVLYSIVKYVQTKHNIKSTDTYHKSYYLLDSPQETKPQEQKGDDSDDRDDTNKPPQTRELIPADDLIQDYVLGTKDIAKITSYDADFYTLSPLALRILAECLADGQSVVTTEQYRPIREALTKLDLLVLRDTGIHLSTNPVNEISRPVQQVVWVTRESANNKGAVAKIRQRLGFLQYRSKNPPFRTRVDIKGRSFDVRLEGGNKRTTKQTLNDIVIDRGNKKEASIVTARDQLALIDLFLRKPTVSRSAIAKAFSGVGGRGIAQQIPTLELTTFLSAVDKIFSGWGLAIEEYKEVEKDKKDRIISSEQFFQLVPLTPAHKEIVPFDEVFNVDEEAAALPQRQRRRQPSHAKLKL